jgi:SpoIID/LytB domain protein
MPCCHRRLVTLLLIAVFCLLYSAGSWSSFQTRSLFQARNNPVESRRPTATASAASVRLVQVRSGALTTGIPAQIRVHLVHRNLTLSVSFDEYCVGVLRAESSVEDRLEALKAQAIVSRTFALKNLGRHQQEGYDFCSITHCQRYAPKTSDSARERLYERAVAETSGQVLLDDQGGLVDAYFNACCGGATANIGSIWGIKAAPYLQGVVDPYCRAAPNANWTLILRADKLARALRTDPRTDVGSVVKSIFVESRDNAGRATTVAIEGNRIVSVRAWDFKIIVGRSLGWSILKSSWFDVAPTLNGFVFHGHGFGHGIGLCQEGAHVMAKRGASCAEILAHYFPTTQISANLDNMGPSPKVHGDDRRPDYGRAKCKLVVSSRSHRSIQSKRLSSLRSRTINCRICGASTEMGKLDLFNCEKLGVAFHPGRPYFPHFCVCKSLAYQIFGLANPHV